MTNDFVSTLDSISVAYGKSDYAVCIKLCSDALADQKTLAEDTKATLLQFIANCSQKLLDDDTSTGDTPDPACSFVADIRRPCASAPDLLFLSAMNALTCSQTP